MPLGQLHGDIPVVEQDGTVHGLLNFIDPLIAVDGTLTQPDQLELLGQDLKQLIIPLD
jgi:hypothetical protein